MKFGTDVDINELVLHFANKPNKKCVHHKICPSI